MSRAAAVDDQVIGEMSLDAVKERQCRPSAEGVTVARLVVTEGGHGMYQVEAMLAFCAGTGGHSPSLVINKLSQVAVHGGAEAPVAPARLPSAKASEGRGPAHGRGAVLLSLTKRHFSASVL